MEWNLKLHDRPRELVITLQILGEHVNDTYIEGLIERLTQKNWILQHRKQEDEGYILSLERGVRRNVC